MRFLVFLFLLAVLPWTARADEAALARLKADLLSNPSATQVLTQWCGARKLASPAVIRAMRDKANEKPATAEVRALLGAGADEPIRYRRVKLMCGTHILSEADNWYRTGALTGAMNKTLDETDTPFGTVVRPLNFTRRTLDANTNSDAATVLRVRAVLLAGTAPFSLVVENYRPVLLGR
jgi:chorismate-pyruvate lyase